MDAARPGGVVFVEILQQLVAWQRSTVPSIVISARVHWRALARVLRNAPGGVIGRLATDLRAAFPEMKGPVSHDARSPEPIPDGSIGHVGSGASWPRRTRPEHDRLSRRQLARHMLSQCAESVLCQHDNYSGSKWWLDTGRNSAPTRSEPPWRSAYSSPVGPADRRS